MERIKKYLESIGIKYKEEGGDKIIIKTGKQLEWINGFGEVMTQKEEYIISHNTGYEWYNYIIGHRYDYNMVKGYKFKKYKEVINFLEENLK